MRIFDITMADGTPVSSVAEAVNKFMCPGQIGRASCRERV